MDVLGWDSSRINVGGVWMDGRIGLVGGWMVRLGGWEDGGLNWASE